MFFCANKIATNFTRKKMRNISVAEELLRDAINRRFTRPL